MAAGTVKVNDSEGYGFITPARTASPSVLSLALEGAAIPAPDERSEGVTLFGRLEIAPSEVHWLSNATIVERLCDSGVSRLSAERIVAVQRGEVEPGRARRHVTGHRAL
jgi:hypothetical protein